MPLSTVNKLTTTVVVPPGHVTVSHGRYGICGKTTLQLLYSLKTVYIIAGRRKTHWTISIKEIISVKTRFSTILDKIVCIKLNSFSP